MAERSELGDEQPAVEAQDDAPAPAGGQVLEIPLTTEAPRAAPKARGKRGPDKRPRAKPKPRVRTVEKAPVREESSDDSPDEATLQELHSLNLLRSIRAYDSQRHARKQQLYASWFGR